MSELVYDSYGRPYIVIRDAGSKTRLKGLEASSANILAARTVSNILRTSLGPKGACMGGGKGSCEQTFPPECSPSLLTPHRHGQDARVP